MQPTIDQPSTLELVTDSVDDGIEFLSRTPETSKRTHLIRDTIQLVFKARFDGKIQLDKFLDYLNILKHTILNPYITTKDTEGLIGLYNANFPLFAIETPSLPNQKKY